MKTINLLALILLLGSCRSADKLFAKAIQKDPSLVKTITVVREISVPGESKTIKFKDSLVGNDARLKYDIRLIGDSISFHYEVKETAVPCQEVTTSYNPRPSNTEIRQTEKTKRKEIVQAGKTDRKEAVETRKENNKIAQVATKSTGLIYKLITAFAAGFLMANIACVLLIRWMKIRS